MSIFDEVESEVIRARRLHPSYHSYHEAYAVIAEELDEFWEIVRQKDNDRDPEAARKELIQVAATAVRAIGDLGL